MFLGEQSGKCATPPLLAAGRGFPAPPPVRPLRAWRLSAGLAFHPPALPRVCRTFLAAGFTSPWSVGRILTLLSPTPPFPSAQRGPLQSVSLPQSSPHPAPAPASRPSLSFSGVRRFTSPSPFLEPHPYCLLFSQLVSSRRPTPRNRPSSTLGKEGGIWALFPPEAWP